MTTGLPEGTKKPDPYSEAWAAYAEFQRLGGRASNVRDGRGVALCAYCSRPMDYCECDSETVL